MQYVKLDMFQSNTGIDTHLNSIVELNTWLTIDETEERIAFLCGENRQNSDSASVYVNSPYEVLESALSSFYKTVRVDVQFSISDPSTWKSIYGLTLATYQIKVTIRGVLEKCKIQPFRYQLSDIQYLKTIARHHPNVIEVYPTDTYKIEAHIDQKVTPNPNRKYRILQRKTFLLGNQTNIPADLPLITNINGVKLENVHRFSGSLIEVLSSNEDWQKEDHMVLNIKGDTQYRDVSIWMQPERYFRDFKRTQGVERSHKAEAEVIGKIMALDSGVPNPIRVIPKPKWKLYDIEQITTIKEFEVEEE